MRRLLALIALLLAAGCEPLGLAAEEDDEAASADGLEVEPAFVSPSDGAVITSSPWVPLSLRLPISARGARVELRLDGQPWEDPDALLRRRNDRGGGGLDYLATLELLDLAPGPHTLSARITPPGGWPIALESTFTYAPPPHTLTIRTVDGQGAPSAARVAIWKDGRRLLLLGPDADAVDPSRRDTVLASVFAPHGEARLRLEPGHYRLVAVRGLREDLGVAELDLSGDAELTLTLPEVVPTPGVLTADLHVHTGASADSYTPNRPRYAALACAGLDLVVITDHNQVVDPSPHLERQGLDSGLIGVPGAEIPVLGKSATSGHLNAFPLGPGADAPGGRSLAETLDLYRAIADASPWPPAGGRVVQMLNHPRGIQFRPESEPVKGAHGLFSSLGFHRERAMGEGANAWLTEAQPSGTTALDMDALEVVNRFSWVLYRQVRLDWFALLNAGVGVTGTGNSDSHALALELAGSPVNLVDVGEDGSVARFLDALVEGRVSVSTGPVLTMTARDAAGRRWGVGERVTAAGPLVVEARVQAAPWVPVPELRLVRDGRVVARVALPEREPGAGLDYKLQWTLDGSRDGWALVEAGWPLDDDAPAVGGLFADVFPNVPPLAFTNPLWIDGDGDGR